MKMKKLTATLLSAVLGVYAMAGDTLFQNGKTEWKIGISPKAAPAEQYAAQELQTALQKISGAEFPILKSETFPDGNTIIIGSPDSTPQIREKADALKLKKGNTEELAVYTLGGNLYLAGNNPRGALYAVYSFLQNQLGVRWFWPGDDGEFIRKKNSYPLPQLSFNYKPPFRFREMTPCGLHYHVPTEIWLARNFMNGGSRTLSVREKAGFYRLDGGHWVSIGKREFAKHPGYFSLIDNRRVPEGEAGCWSNPDFTKMIVQKHLDLIKKRKFDLLNTFPADITQRCECAECVKNPDPSSRWFQYYHKLIQEIRKSEPQMMFAGIAYQEYRTVPAARVEGLEYVEYCQYNRCYVHKFEDPSCSLNRKSMEELKRWQEKAPMGIYGYEFDVFKGAMYLPFWNMLADEMKHFRDMKLVRMKTELGVYYPKDAKRADLPQQAHRLSNYLYAQLMWNPAAETDTLLRDWCDTVYGAGAEAMYAYHQAMAKAWDSMKIHLTYFGADPGGAAKNLINDKLIQFAKAQFKTAEADVKKEKNPQLRKRHLEEIALEAALFGKWEKAYQVARDNAVTVCPPLLKGGNEFEKLGKLPMTSKKGTHLPTETRIYRTPDALHIQVVCMEPDRKNLRKGKAGRDVNLWNDDSIELFLDLNDGSSYRQMAVNPAGGTYDAAGSDKKWDPVWTATPELEADRWIMNIQIPFASLGKTPKDGDQWKIIVIRNSKPEACGFPAPAHLDLSRAATLYFSKNTDPDRRMTWISTPALAGGRRFESCKTAFLKDGWQVQNVKGPEGAKNVDLSDSKLIVIENYQNKLPLGFYRETLIPAVKNGAVVVFSCYFWVHELHKQFDDPTYQMKFAENASKTRKPSWIAQNSFADTPNKIREVLRHTPSGNFIPAYPGKWEELARQQTAKGEEQPFILARPLGKGMVVLTGDIGGNVKLLENILEYNKAIKR